MEEIEITCVKCGKQMTSYIIIESGDIDPKFCSDECEIEYYEKKENK